MTVGEGCDFERTHPQRQGPSPSPSAARLRSRRRWASGALPIRRSCRRWWRPCISAPARRAHRLGQLRRLPHRRAGGRRVLLRAAPARLDAGALLVSALTTGAMAASSVALRLPAAALPRRLRQRLRPRLHLVAGAGPAVGDRPRPHGRASVRRRRRRHRDLRRSWSRNWRRITSRGSGNGWPARRCRSWRWRRSRSSSHPDRTYGGLQPAAATAPPSASRSRR